MIVNDRRVGKRERGQVMVYKRLMLGNSVYEFHKCYGERVVLVRLEFTEEISAGGEPREVDRMEFESESELDEYFSRLISMKRAHDGLQEALSDNLDVMGRLFECPRRDGEDDEVYRPRLKAVIGKI